MKRPLRLRVGDLEVSPEITRRSSTLGKQMSERHSEGSSLGRGIEILTDQRHGV